jgi:hypothetical protein
VQDEEALEALINLADQEGAVYTVTREPDLDGQITAVSFAPSGFHRYLSHLPLAMREMANA